MGYIHEYLDRMKNGYSIINLQEELCELLKKINQHCGCTSFLYAGSLEKPIREASMIREDFTVTYDMLRGIRGRKLLVYLETSGGCGQTAERMAKFFREQFDEVVFVIAGSAMSAGTILALSGDEIYMTKGGNLGPIDAQVPLGRSYISAHDYLSWVDKRRKEAEEKQNLNPVDATIIAQISPGELRGMYTALHFAIDLVKSWLTKYKFKNWNQTQDTSRPVTLEMKEKRASEIAEALTDQSKWRSHGRAITFDDLEQIGLKIHKVEDDAVFSDFVHRIQVICWLLFSNSTTYKLYATDTQRISRQAAKPSGEVAPQQNQSSGLADVVEFELLCPDCGEKHLIYAKFINDPNIDKAYQDKGAVSFPSSCIFKCNCGFEIDLTGIKAQIEGEAGRPLVF